MLGLLDGLYWTAAKPAGGTRIMLYAVTVNLDHFIRDLQNGDPFVWTIAILMVAFTVFGLYQKYRASCATRASETN